MGRTKACDDDVCPKLKTPEGEEIYKITKARDIAKTT